MLVRRVARQGEATRGVVVSRATVVPEVCVTADGVYWHPVAVSVNPPDPFPTASDADPPPLLITVRGAGVTGFHPWLTESMRVNGQPSKVVFQHRTAHGDLFVATQRNVDLGLVQPTLVDLIWSEASAVRQSRSPSESEESRDRSVDLAAWRTRDDQTPAALVIDGVPAHGLTYESAGTHTTGVDVGDILVAVSGPSDNVALVRLILRG